MNNALKKINARVKVLQKKHPKSKRTTLQKQAGREWKSGKLKGAAKKTAKKKTVTRKRTVRKKAVRKKSAVSRSRSLSVTKPKSRRVYKARLTTVRSYKGRRYKRISGIGKMSSMVPIVAVAGLGLLAYYLISRQPVQQFPPTSSPIRAQAQNSILSWAMAAGLTATAISNIINSLSNSDDDTVSQVASSPGDYFNPLGMGI